MDPFLKNSFSLTSGIVCQRRLLRLALLHDLCQGDEHLGLDPEDVLSVLWAVNGHIGEERVEREGKVFGCGNA